MKFLFIILLLFSCSTGAPKRKTAALDPITQCLSLIKKLISEKEITREQVSTLLEQAVYKVKPVGQGKPFIEYAEDLRFVILPNRESRAWALKEGFIQEYTLDENINIPPGIYNYVITNDGSLRIGQIDDSTEFGVRHISLANDNPVVSAGQLDVQDNGDYSFNIGSGTFTAELVTSSGVNSFELENLSSKVLAFYFGKKGKIRSIHSLRPDQTIELSKLKELCLLLHFSHVNKRSCSQLKKL